MHAAVDDPAVIRFSISLVVVDPLNLAFSRRTDDGRRTDFRLRGALQIRRKIGIDAHGGRGAYGPRDGLGQSSQILVARGGMLLAPHLARDAENQSG